MNNKLNVILDLDETLISSLNKYEQQKYDKKINHLDFSHISMKNNEYKIYLRPGLEDFLDHVFLNYNVSVWTAASKEYALFVIDKIILANKPNRHLDFILFSHHCKNSKHNTNYHKKISEVHFFNLDTTYIIDDNIEVYKAQPTKCISIKPFNVLKKKASKDQELKTIQNILKELQQII